MNIDFSLPTQKWILKHVAYQNNTERNLIKWAYEVVREELADVFTVKSFLKKNLEDLAKSHKSREMPCRFTKIEISEDCKSVSIISPRFDLNSDKEIVNEFYVTLVTLTNHGAQTKK